MLEQYFNIYIEPCPPPPPPPTFLSPRFRTREADAWLATSGSDHAFEVYLTCGYLKLAYLLPGHSHRTILHHPMLLDDDQWHRVHIRRRPYCQLQLTVDSKTTKSKDIPTGIEESCVPALWNTVDIAGLHFSESVKTSQIVPALQGCMGSFAFDHMLLQTPLFKRVERSPAPNIQLNCPSLPFYCSSSPCQHGGQCKERSASFECDCSQTDYSGDRCHLGMYHCPILSVV